METSVLGIALSCIVALIGGARWILKIYFKEQKEHQKTKETIYQGHIKQFDERLKGHEAKLEANTKKLELNIQVTDSMSREFREMRREVNTYTTESHQRFGAIETEVKKLKDGFIFVKNKTKGAKQ